MLDSHFSLSTHSFYVICTLFSFFLSFFVFFQCRYEIDRVDENNMDQSSKLTLATHLKHHWLWSMEQIFNEVLHGNEHDVLIFEDDVIVSPDVFQVSSFASSLKQRGRTTTTTSTSSPPPSIIALAGWNGEHLLAPAPDTFRVILGRSFPTLGYSFNATFYRLIATLAPHIRETTSGA